MCPDVTFLQERIYDCGHRKRDKQSVNVNSFLQVSCYSNESVVQQERSNCIVSSIRLSARFDWHNFALALAVSFTTFGLITSGSGALCNECPPQQHAVGHKYDRSWGDTWAMPTPHQRNCCVILSWSLRTDQLQ